jgi:hypothetical protein
MFSCFCASFKSPEKSPLYHSLEQTLLEEAEVGVRNATFSAKTVNVYNLSSYKIATCSIRRTEKNMR